MPRPNPLRNVTSGRPQSDYQSLTPRTPHSRLGRAEEAVPNNEPDEFRSYRQQQTEPLLASSASDSFPPTGYRGQGDDRDHHGGPRAGEGGDDKLQVVAALVLDRTPLVIGMIMAGALFFATIVSWKRPDVLQYYIGDAYGLDRTANPTPASNEVEASQYLISYENYTQFPLNPREYEAECERLNSGYRKHIGGYWDVQPPPAPTDVAHRVSTNEGTTTVCEKTVTYMLDGYVGLLADLSLMAQAAGLAREQNRTFFIDDRYWNRGKWTDHFLPVQEGQPGPEPGCRPPPPEELVACPRTARHWIVSSRTARYHFGHAYEEAYQNPYGRELNRQKPMFDMARQSFTDTIRPNTETADLIQKMRSEITYLMKAGPYDPANDGTSYVSVHIRRGNRRAMSWEYYQTETGYVPVEKFVTALQSTAYRIYTESPELQGGPLVYLASDSPEASQEFIKSMNSHTAVWSLSRSASAELRELASPTEYKQIEFNVLEEDERIKLTRGMIVDLASLSGMWPWEGDLVPDSTICTLTSNVCKMAAVGLGWEKAFAAKKDGSIDDHLKRWVEIDNGGNMVPAWEAYELFN